MGQTLAQKILARASGRASVEPGEIVVARADLLVLIDLTFLRYVEAMREIGPSRIWDPERVILVVDHEAPTTTVAGEQKHQAMRRLAKEIGLRHVYDIGQHGNSNVLPAEKGLVRPGMLVLGADTHATTLGAVGAFATFVNYEAPIVMALGEMWLQVPETIRVEIAGQPPPGVMSRDIAQWIIGEVGFAGGNYRAFEFAGPTVARMSIDERMTLANVCVEVGGKTGLVNPDATTLAYVGARTSAPVEPVLADADARYGATVRVDVSGLPPQVAVPPRPDVVRPVTAEAGTRVSHAFVGSCASGRMEDLKAAARILKNHAVHPDVRLLIVPSSQDIFAEAAREGLLEVFSRAGAAVVTTTCGPCFSGMQPLADGDVCICTGTRNDPGRKGSHAARIYLASALTVAASAVKGEIADPREFL